MGIRIFCSWLFILLIVSLGFSQEQFIQFTCFDQLAWSDDGNQLAFRCVLLDESNPEQIRTNLLVKNLKSDRLACLDPQPERFIISRDQKYFLFSSSYGLYLVSLEENNRAVQLYFRNPAATWFFQDFGFLKDGSTIYIDRYESATMKTVQESFRIPSPGFSSQFIDWFALKKIRNKSRSSRFDLPIDEMKEKLQTAIQIKDIRIEFLSQPDADDPGNFKLVYQPSRKSAVHSVLMERCRPRFLSVNPDSTEIIASVFQQGEHQTFRFPISSRQLIAIEKKRYFSISWLDAKQYICLTEDGLFLRNLDLSVNRKIDQWQIPEWCKGVNLDLPKYELQVGFEPEKHRAEQLISKLQKSGFHARMKYFKDQSKAGYRIRVGGFLTREQAQMTGEQLKKKGFEFWIDKVTDAYDFFNSMRSEEQKLYGDKIAIVEYRMDNYVRSRIVLKMPNKKEQVLVDEMNNIPVREKW
ncbi:SPOR domain-containing protein [candidate division KSB1 bacterium]|nr:SPOR domain-containing protein [candidate division KSB1 bacterium]